MSLVAEMVDEMAAAGATGEIIAIAVRAMTKAEQADADRRRKRAEQKANERRRATVARQNGDSRATSLPKKERVPPTPPLQEKTPTLFPDSAIAESSPRAEKTNDFNELLDWFENQWNGLAAACGLPKIQAMTDARISHIRRRADDLVRALRFPDPQSGFTETFNRIRGSPWLRGANGRAWKADVDWILTESNFLQIHEGKYARDQRPEHHRR